VCTIVTACSIKYSDFPNTRENDGFYKSMLFQVISLIFLYIHFLIIKQLCVVCKTSDNGKDKNLNIARKYLFRNFRNFLTKTTYRV